MYVVVTGAGQVGYHVARVLSEEGHSVAVLERDPKALERVGNLDVLAVEGSGASPDKLLKAGLEGADLFIGATGDDEANMVGCAIAHARGVRTIARINDPEYIVEPYTERYKDIGIDVAVCPELVAADKIYRILTTPSLLDMDIFADGRVSVVEAMVDPSAPITGRRIRDVEPPRGARLLAIFRNGDVILPHGEETLRPYDRVLVTMLRPELVVEVERIIGRRHQVGLGPRVHKVMIAGATRIGVHLADLLEKDHEVVMVDESTERCERATERLEKTLVINENATRRSVLIDEGVESFDAFIGAHPVEEYNILACLIARQMGVPRTAALLNQPELKDIAEATGIDLAMTPQHATVGAVLRWTHQAETLDLVLTRGEHTELIELKVHEDSKVAGKPLKDAELPEDCRVGAIVRGEEVILPGGEDTLKPGDRVVVLVRTDAIGQLEELF